MRRCRTIATLTTLCSVAQVLCTSGCECNSGRCAGGVSTAEPCVVDRVEQHDDPQVDEPGTETELEKLTGYHVQAELLTVGSKHLPGGVVAVALPANYDTSPQKSYPLVLAFGGAGECSREPRRGALAWIEYYEADDALVALKTNSLSARDLKGLTTPGQLAALNKRLQSSPFNGVILACPSSPLISEEYPLDSPRYEAFIMDEVIPRLTERYRVATGRIGIDGVSMGGARSMYYGLKHPETFASIGAVQGAFGRYFAIYRSLIRQNQEALSKIPIQLVTSDGDGLAPGVAMMHKILTAHDVPHDYLMLTGPHDYIFNQGPGVVSLLMFHDEALWGEGE